MGINSKLVTTTVLLLFGVVGVGIWFAGSYLPTTTFHCQSQPSLLGGVYKGYFVVQYANRPLLNPNMPAYSHVEQTEKEGEILLVIKKSNLALDGPLVAKVVLDDQTIDLNLSIDEHCGLKVLHTTYELSEAGQAAASFAKRFLSMLDISMSENAQASWTKRHSDITGTYIADYQYIANNSEAIHITRSRRHYIDISQDMAKQGYQANIIQSSIRAELEPQKFWFSAVSGIEDISITNKGKAILQTRVEFQLERIANSIDGLSHVPPQTTPALINRPQQHKTDVEPAHNDEQSEAPVASETDLSLVLQSLKQNLENGDKSAALQRIISHLRRWPDSAYELLELILEPHQDPKIRALLFFALGKADTDIANTILMTSFEDDSLSPKIRSQAAFALAASPASAFEKSLPLIAQLEHKDLTSSLTSQSALLALTQLSSQLESPDDPVRQMVRETLTSKMTSAKSEQTMITVLSAAHNAAELELYPSLIEQLSNPSPHIQELSISAVQRTLQLRGKQASEADIEKIAGLLNKSSSVAVRKSAISFLASQDHVAQSKQILLQLALKESNPEILKALGRELKPEELSNFHQSH